MLIHDLQICQEHRFVEGEGPLDTDKPYCSKLVVLMGKVAWHTPRCPGIAYVETYHPAAAMRFPEIREKFVNDFRKIGEQHGKKS